MGNVGICTVRESESLRYLQSLIPDVRVEQTADVAFLLPVTPTEEARHILEVEHHFPIAGRRLVALSVSSGILSFRADVNALAYICEEIGRASFRVRVCLYVSISVVAVSLKKKKDKYENA